MTMQNRLDRHLRIAERLQFWAVVVAVSYLAAIGFLVFGQ